MNFPYSLWASKNNHFSWSCAFQRSSASFSNHFFLDHFFFAAFFTYASSSMFHSLIASSYNRTFSLLILHPIASNATTNFHGYRQSLVTTKLCPLCVFRSCTLPHRRIISRSPFSWIISSFALGYHEILSILRNYIDTIDVCEYH